MNHEPPTLLQGDCLTILPTIPGESVQCCVTSPPYFGLRDYGTPPTSWPAVDYPTVGGTVSVPTMECCFGAEPTPEYLQIARARMGLAQPDPTPEFEIE